MNVKTQNFGPRLRPVNFDSGRTSARPWRRCDSFLLTIHSLLFFAMPCRLSPLPRRFACGRASLRASVGAPPPAAPAADRRRAAPQAEAMVRDDGLLPHVLQIEEDDQAPRGAEPAAGAGPAPSAAPARVPRSTRAPQVGEIKLVTDPAGEDAEDKGKLFSIHLNDRDYLLKAVDAAAAARWVEVLNQLKNNANTNVAEPKDAEGADKAGAEFNKSSRGLRACLPCCFN